MTFGEKARGVFNRGVSASRDLTKKARGKAKELSAMGVVKLEIMQLESHVEKLIAKLGKEVYMTLVDKNHATVSRETPSIRRILNEIEELRTRKELKEKEYRAIGGRGKKTLGASR
ncbi:MAG: hypothetical protein ABSG38_10395 [Spirochaetia bacterium]|jgi:hypothetical protein